MSSSTLKQQDNASEVPNVTFYPGWLSGPGQTGGALRGLCDMLAALQLTRAVRMSRNAVLRSGNVRIAIFLR
jgi:hypothetical protein